MVKSSKRANIWKALVAVACLFTAYSCQSTVDDDPARPQTIEFGFDINNLQLRPDSASWRVKTKAGNAHLSHTSGTKSSLFSVNIQLEHQLGSDTLNLSLWIASMLTAEYDIRPKDNAWLPIAVRRDTLATILLDKLSDLNTLNPTDYPLKTDSSLAKAMAILVVENDTLFRTWKTKHPVGIDTARMQREALIYAASKGLPLANIASHWALGLDATQAKQAILALIPQFIPVSDTTALFPAPPVRVTQPVGVVGKLYSDSTSVAITGRFAAKNRLFTPVLRVLADGQEVKNHFEIIQPNSPNPSTTAWDLATDGNITLRAFGKAPVGTYTLVVSMEDGNYSDSSKIDFQVLPKPDQQGPSLERIQPLTDTLMGQDSSLLIRIKATDSSGIKSLILNGRPLVKTGAFYEITEIIPGTGLWTNLTITALDTLNNSSQVEVHARRNSTSTSKLSATPIEPAARFGDTIPTSQATRHVVWKITDPAGVLPSNVWINLKAATKVNDSTWSADVPVPPTGVGTVVQVQALNTNSSSVVDSVVLVRRKDKTAPLITPLTGTRSLIFDSTTAKVIWKVVDNQNIDSIWVNGIPNTPRSDNTYSFTLSSLKVGPTKIDILARDSAGNLAADTQTITRMPNTLSPTLKRVSGTGDLVIAYGSDSAMVQWIASGNEKMDSVAINGRKASVSHDTFSLKVRLLPGNVPVVAQAWNLSGLSAKDSVTIQVKLRDKDGYFYSIRTMPDGRIWMAQNLKSLPVGSLTCALADCDKYGGLYSWSQAMSLAATADGATSGYTDSSLIQGICPTGWHLPIHSEWSALFRSTMSAAAVDSAEALKSATGWVGQFCRISKSGSTCTPTSANGTNLYNDFLKPSAGDLATSSWSSYWTPGETATTATTMRFSGGSLLLASPLVTTPAVNKTEPSVARCIKDLPRRIIIIRDPGIFQLSTTN